MSIRSAGAGEVSLEGLVALLQRSTEKNELESLAGKQEGFAALEDKTKEKRERIEGAESKIREKDSALSAKLERGPGFFDALLFKGGWHNRDLNMKRADIAADQAQLDNQNVALAADKERMSDTLEGMRESFENASANSEDLSAAMEQIAAAKEHALEKMKG